MTVNTHKGFTALQPQVHPAGAARGGAHGGRRRGVPAGGAGHARAPLAARSTTGRRRRTTNSWPTRIWPQFAYGRNAVYPKGHHGNAVLSKFPIVHYQNHDVSIAGPEKRGLLHCVLRAARPRRSTCTRSACTWAWPRAHRLQQLELLCHIVRDEVPADAPLIVAGDFNDWRGRAHDILEQRRRPARGVRAGQRQRGAGPSRRAFRCCRWTASTCATPRVHAPVVLPRRPWSHLSDHAPLVAEIEL